MKSKIPKLCLHLEPGSAFNDERFIELLHHRRDGLTTRQENDYIEVELKRNPAARQLLDLLIESFPAENFSPPRKQRKCIYIICIVVLCILTGGVIFSLGKRGQSETPTARQVEIYRFEQQTLGELRSVIEQYYEIKVKFDRQQVATYRYSGSLNPRLPLRVFLDKLRDSGGIEYYFDK